MGEQKHVRIVRAVCVAALVAAAATALTSCSALGRTPGSPVASASGPVLDPSIPSATPSDTAATGSPAPTVDATTVAPTAAPTAAAKTAVVPFITSATWDTSAKELDVSAIVPSVVEAGGSCVVTIGSGTVTRTATGAGVAASSYTGCEAVAFKDVAPGSWQVRVRYESSKAAGSSAVQVVQVG